MQSYGGRSQNTPYLAPKSPISYSSDARQPSVEEREETERYARADSPTLLNLPAADVEALAPPVVPPVVTYFTPNRRLVSLLSLYHPELMR